jgi:hypothetical protein
MLERRWNENKQQCTNDASSRCHQRHGTDHARVPGAVSTRPSAVLLIVVLGACSEDDGLDLPPLEFESTRSTIGIGSAAAYPLCSADFAHIDRRIEFIEDHLGVRRSAPVEIYLLDLPVLSEHCATDTAACYFPGEDIILASWQTIDHELVHAVARDIEFPSLFWKEGNAEVLSGKTTRKDTRVVLQPEDLEATTLTTHLSAAHFSRFLVETRGWDAYNRAIRGEPLEEIYGENAAQLTEAYERDTPYAYPPLDPCPFPSLPEIEPGVWRERVDVSCESPDATQFEWVTHSRAPGAAVVRSVELDAGTYAFEFNGGVEFIALACHTEELSEEPTPPSNGDLYNEADFWTGTPFPPVGTILLNLTAGTYWVSMSGGFTSVTDAVEAELTITRVE